MGVSMGLGDLQNGWFIRCSTGKYETKMDDNWVPPHFRTPDFINKALGIASRGNVPKIIQLRRGLVGIGTVLSDVATQ